MTDMQYPDGHASTAGLVHGETDTQPEPLPDRIGGYRVLKCLGRGGMGVVYLAEQTEPVRRRVALKIIQAELRSREATLRFESERQAMARLSHPNVAQMFEAGTTEGGHLFSAMELVDGMPITRYCDERKLSIHERLDLMRTVCDGVQHAHQKGILHRDLKPGNILVTEIDDHPVAKIIDFGIAKAIDQPLVDGTQCTGDRLIGTPAYISPEAVEMTGFDIDTRSDVYSLGVVLYVLLVGVRPFDSASQSFVQILRKIAEDEPTSPSARWQALSTTTQKETASKRGMTPSVLGRCLQRDLDWIVLKAIAKDRRQRYGSPAELAADLLRYLTHQPVEASPPSTLYRAAKFIRRRRGVVVAAALILLSLLLGLSGTTVGLVRASRDDTVYLAAGHRLRPTHPADPSLNLGISPYRIVFCSPLAPQLRPLPASFSTRYHPAPLVASHRGKGITIPGGVASAGPYVLIQGLPLFADGFESGNTSAWSAVVP